MHDGQDTTPCRSEADTADSALESIAADTGEIRAAEPYMKTAFVFAVGVVLGVVVALFLERPSDATAAWLGIGAALGTIVTGIAALFIVSQINLAKQTLNQAKADLRIRSTREAVTLSYQLCERFATFIIPKYDEQIHALAAQNLTLFKWTLTDANFTRDSIAERLEADKWLALFNSDRQKCYRIVNMLNILEAFAMPFANGLADESVAFPVVGTIFLDEVEGFAPYLISLREKTAPHMVSGRYENVVKLYELWAARVGAERISEQMAELMRQHRNLPKPAPIPPIGGFRKEA